MKAMSRKWSIWHLFQTFGGSCILNFLGVELFANLHPLKNMLHEQPKENEAPSVSGSLPWHIHVLLKWEEVISRTIKGWYLDDKNMNITTTKNDYRGLLKTCHSKNRYFSTPTPWYTYSPSILGTFLLSCPKVTNSALPLVWQRKK